MTLIRRLNREFLGNTFFFGLTMLSAVAFSSITLLARFVAPETLPELIQFQTTSVFLAFVVQAGLRAGMRNQHHLGRQRVVVEAEKQIRRHLPLATLAISLCCYWLGYAFCPAFAVLHALLSLLINLRMAQNRLPQAALWSALTFLSTVLPCLAIVISGLPLVSLRIPIELFAIGFLFLVAFRIHPRKAGFRALMGTLRRSVGIQLGALSVYFLNFLLGQYIILLSQADLRKAIAYADIQILCGIQSMLFSRLYLLIEGKVMRRGETLKVSGLCIGWAGIFGLAVYLLARLNKDPELALFYAVLAFSNLGAIPLGTISQFMKERYRLESLVLAGMTAAFLAYIVYSRYQSEFPGLIVLLTSPTLIAIVLCVRALFSKSGYFIQKELAHR